MQNLKSDKLQKMVHYDYVRHIYGRPLFDLKICLH